jgi:hypothetical protein
VAGSLNEGGDLERETKPELLQDFLKDEKQWGRGLGMHFK